MDKWTRIPGDQEIDETIVALRNRNINAEVVNTGKDAHDRVWELLPTGSRVLTSTSVTLETIGIKEEIENSDKVVSVRKEYMALDHNKDADKIRALRSTPQIIIASVHAVTKKGEVLIASNTGSQLAAYAYGAVKVIWIVGAQKIVEDLEEGRKRIYEYVLPLETERLKRTVGKDTNVGKLLTFNGEVIKDRVTLIFVKEKLGF